MGRGEWGVGSGESGVDQYKNCFTQFFSIKKPFNFLKGFLSGQLDSNQRPPAPKAGILTGLNYAPNNYFTQG